MEQRNKYGLNVKIEPLAQKLIETASAEGATAHEFWLACEKAQRMVGEKSRQLLVQEICGDLKTDL